MSRDNIDLVFGGATTAEYKNVPNNHDYKHNRRELFVAAHTLRNKFKGTTVTFSKKAFLNVINLCRDTCTYCTYKAKPTELKASMMSRAQIKNSISLAKRYGCVEALLVTGERPEQRYPEARKWLSDNKFESTADCLAYASEMALESGLFPHTNAGNLEPDEIRQLGRTNVSMGLMLENVSPRLTQKGMPHHMAASKRPKERIRVLEEAGRQKIPMTTGLLIGIGETIHEVIDSLFAIRDIHRKYHHIQEIILQNFQPKMDTSMCNTLPANEEYFMDMVAACRVIMPQVNIQIPPNLSPDSYRTFLSAGINDWGGISPITPDYVNPEFPWPKIQKLSQDTKNAGFHLQCRLPVYPEFIELVKDKRLRKMILDNTCKDGLVKEERWK